jgi:two-component system, LytTR family, sensor kinase
MSETEERNASWIILPSCYWQKALIFTGIWTLYGLFFALQAYISSAYAGRTVSFEQTLLPWLSCGYVWALLTPFVIKLTRRFPIEKGKLLRTLLIHLFAGTIFSVLHLTILVFLRQLLIGDFSESFSPLQSFQNVLIADFHANLLLYWTVVGLWHAYNYYRRFRERERLAAQLEIEAAVLEKQLAQSQLDALRMQLHPHFLFNTLNSISVLMRDDTPAANRMLVRLSELLRIALKSESKQEIPLRQELEFLTGYLEIEQMRFQDHLTVDFDIEKETLDAHVPNLILQPLVENAIRHGIAPRAEAGFIQVKARRENGCVELSVEDNGAGLNETEGITGGIGLSNTRKRLEKLYGEQYGFEVISPSTGGLQVKLKIPFHTKGDGK